MPSQTPRRVGVVLSGCGFLDSAEIHRATLTLLFLDRQGAKVTAMAPAVDQMHVVDHLAGEPVPGDRRGALAESARIARGQIVDMAKVRTDDLDALILAAATGRPRTSARAKVLSELKPRLTIGNDPDTASAVNAFGAQHVDCAVDQVVVDGKNRVASTPAYMLGPTIARVAAGIEKLVAAVLEMACPALRRGKSLRLLTGIKAGGM